MLLNHRILGQGPPIIILHGLFGSLDNWMSMGRLLAKNHTVYLADLRNHGGSFHKDEFNYQVMADDLKNLVESANLNYFSIIGHSMGGKVGMFYAAEYQQSIKHLIVVDIGPKYYPVHHQKILDGLSAIDPAKLTDRGQADLLLSSFIPESGIRQFLLKNLKRNSGGSFEWKMNLPAIREQIENVGEELTSHAVIKVPSLFIRGALSDYISDQDIDRIKLQFPAFKVKTIPQSGHWVHAEAPQDFFQTVEDFLQRD